MLSPGKLADLPLGVLRQTDSFQSGHRLVAVLLGDGTKPADSPVESHRDHIQGGHREVPVHRRPLRNIGNAISDRLVRSAEKANFPRDGGDQPQAGLEQRALASAVRSHDRDQLTGRCVVLDVPHYRLAMVGHRQVVDRQRRVDRVFRPDLTDINNTVRAHEIKRRTKVAGPLSAGTRLRYGVPIIDRLLWTPAAGRSSPARGRFPPTPRSLA